MSRTFHAFPAVQRGQALVEVIVVAAAMLPAFLAVPLIAKYQDIRHAAVAASRTAAFECSVRPDTCNDPATQTAFAADLRRRHFGRHAHDLLTADAMTEDAAPGERNRFWVDRRGTDLLARASDVDLALSVGDSDAARGAWDRAGSEAGVGPGRGASTRPNPIAIGVGPEAFGLDTAHGMVTARVRAGVSLHRTLAQWLEKPEGMSLALSGKTAVMADAWNASSAKDDDASSIQSRVERGRRLPGLGGSEVGTEEAFDLLYAPIRELITGPLLAPVEPRGTLFRYHEIDVEIVPADRIGQP